MLVARRASQRLLIDQLAEAIEEGRVPGFDRDACQRLLKSERGKFFCCVREQIDADADRPDLGGRLEYTAGNAAPLQRKSKRQSANAGPNDDDVVHVSFRRALSGDCRDETRLVRPLSIEAQDSLSSSQSSDRLIQLQREEASPRDLLLLSQAHMALRLSRKKGLFLDLSGVNSKLRAQWIAETSLRGLYFMAITKNIGSGEKTCIHQLCCLAWHSAPAGP